MILVDVANGKQRHVPYRDSRLTFLLQDSFASNLLRRGKLIQNNAVVNEDSTGDVIALQHQIRLLKEELSTLKRFQTNWTKGVNTQLRKDIKHIHDQGDSLHSYNQFSVAKTILNS